MNRRQRARKMERRRAHSQRLDIPVLTREELEALTKPVLKQLAEDRGMVVKSKTTKQQMVDFITGVPA